EVTTCANWEGAILKECCHFLTCSGNLNFNWSALILPRVIPVRTFILDISIRRMDDYLAWFFTAGLLFYFFDYLFLGFFFKNYWAFFKFGFPSLVSIGNDMIYSPFHKT